MPIAPTIGRGRHALDPTRAHALARMDDAIASVRIDFVSGQITVGCYRHALPPRSRVGRPRLLINDCVRWLRQALRTYDEPSLFIHRRIARGRRR